MAEARFTVLSTAFAPPEAAKARCYASVAQQFRPPIGPWCEHVYLDAAKRYGGPSHFAQLVEVISKLPDDRIVACLDGDDWLGPPNALTTVARYFQAGALVSYGTFRFADGRRGHPSEGYRAGEDVRRAPWKATHLKCFRAGLFKRIKHEDLQMGGEWLPHARDLALMFPLLEMAGHDRSAHVREEIYVYNLATSVEANADEATRKLERECVQHVRGLAPYARVP